MRRNKFFVENAELFTQLEFSKNKFERELDRICRKYCHPFENNIRIHLSELDLKYPGTLFSPCEENESCGTCLWQFDSVKSNKEVDVRDAHQKKTVVYQNVRFDDLIEPDCVPSLCTAMNPVHESTNTDNKKRNYPTCIFNAEHQLEVTCRPFASGSGSAYVCSSYTSNSDFKCRTGDSSMVSITPCSSAECLMNKIVCAPNWSDVASEELTLMKYCNDFFSCRKEMLSCETHCNITVAEMYPSILQIFNNTIQRNCERALTKAAAAIVINYYRNLRQRNKNRHAIKDHPYISRQTALHMSSLSDSSFSSSRPKIFNSCPPNYLSAALPNALDFQSGTAKKNKTDCCSSFDLHFPKEHLGCSKPIRKVPKTQCHFPLNSATNGPKTIKTKSADPYKHFQVDSASLPSSYSTQRSSSLWSSYYPNTQRSRKEMLDEFHHLYQGLAKQNRKHSCLTPVHLEYEAPLQSVTVNNSNRFLSPCLPVKRKLRNEPSIEDMLFSSSVKKIKTLPGNRSPHCVPKCSFGVDDILLQNVVNDAEEMPLTRRRYSKNIYSTNVALRASCCSATPSHHSMNFEKMELH
ncbi:uncharacterized protein LOC122801541 [Protopterus annectens]|uniref:uncharacterized protein LOC122801541 n=1 Tax=Protopterus annectens TaxID=7888 RepID=UPI001CF9A9B1|nr:uncharacterized protein LOC122801541 [Protopterus annectens]